MSVPIYVIDNGASRCRIGLAGDPQPRYAFQNGVAKGKNDTRFLFGSEIDETKSVNNLNIRRPFDRGYLINWKLETSIWARMLEQYIPEASTAEAGLVMTEPMFNLPAIQRTTLEIVYEQFGFQSFYAAPAPEFAMHKWAADNPHDSVAQSLSGVVLDAGYSFTHAVPVFDGRAQRAAARRIRLGGKLLTNLMKEWVRLLSVRKWTVSYRSINLKDEAHLVEHVKEQVCYVAADARTEMARAMPAKKSQISLEVLLPDGVENIRGIVKDPRDPRWIAERAEQAAAGRSKQAVLHVNNERFMVPEALFSPSDINVDQAGVCETISNALNAAHPVFRPLLTQNVLLIGGTSSCPGFKQRVEQDLRPLLDCDFDMHVNQPAQPASAAWHGANVFVTTGQFGTRAVPRVDYEELGAHRLQALMQR